MLAVPIDLLSRPFTNAQANAQGISEKVLRGRRFRRLFPRVWVHVDHPMTPGDWILAGHLAMPPDARLTGLTRIQQLGLDHGPAFPLHFVVARDHHIAIDRIMLHRTNRMPPADDAAVVPTAAYLAYCADALTIDAIVVGDWLLREGHMSLAALAELACQDDWRAGSAQALWVSRYLDRRSRSPAESRWRATFVFAGLPTPEANVELTIDGRLVITDLAWRRYRAHVEHEGTHHQTDRRQYLSDLDRYALLRATDQRYLQLTKEHARNAIAATQKVYLMLRAGGYDGPAPEFGARFRTLHQRIPADVSRRRHHGR